MFFLEKSKGCLPVNSIIIKRVQTLGHAFFDLVLIWKRMDAYGYIGMAFQILLEFTS
jgi:hypothetical protein